MDMTDMTYDEGSMDVVIDKGALDALMSDDSGEYAHTYIHTYIHACIITSYLHLSPCYRGIYSEGQQDVQMYW